MNNVAIQHAYAYLLSGKVNTTFHNTQTGKQLSIKIFQKSIGIWYVYHSNNYLGYIRGDVFIHNPDSNYSILPAQQFSWVWKQVVAGTLPDTMHILHNGACGHCGRPLKDAFSLETGLGPVCAKKAGIIHSHSKTAA